MYIAEPSPTWPGPGAATGHSRKRRTVIVSPRTSRGHCQRPPTTTPRRRGPIDRRGDDTSPNTSTVARTTAPGVVRPSPGQYHVDVSGWLTAIVFAAAVWVATWVVLTLLARRMPPGLLRDLLEFIPACVTTARRLRRHPMVPRRVKVALVVAIVWTLSPIDLLPESLPVIGLFDDIVVIVLALRYAGRALPREVLLEAWPAEHRLLKRLLGPERARPPERDADGPAECTGRFSALRRRRHRRPRCTHRSRRR